MLHGLQYFSISPFMCHRFAHSARHTPPLQGWWSRKHSELHINDQIILVRRSNSFRGSAPTIFRPEDLGLHQWKVSPQIWSFNNFSSSHRIHKCVLRVGSCCASFYSGALIVSLDTIFCWRHIEYSWLLCSCVLWFHQWHIYTCRLLHTCLG